MLDNIITPNVVHQSSITLILFATLMTLILSILLVFTYDKTAKEMDRPDNFVQSLLLMSIVTCTIIQSIGDSIAVGFGIFGALAIIRFRTWINDPRDVSFIFAAMAIGIACGVHSFVNGAIGTVIFCLIAFFLRLTPFGHSAHMIASLKVNVPKDTFSHSGVEEILKSYSKEYYIKRVRTNNASTEIDYQFLLIKGVDITQISNAINQLSPEVSITKITLEEERNEE
jgi:uncharacterized membrane protein YhiD involved in acid resistance